MTSIQIEMLTYVVFDGYGQAEIAEIMGGSVCNFAKIFNNQENFENKLIKNALLLATY